MFETVVLKKSTLDAQGPLLTSKFQKASLLLDPEELAQFFTGINTLFPQSALYFGAGLVDAGMGKVSFDEYLAAYAAFVDPLKTGLLPPKPSLILSSFLSLTEECLYAVEIEGGKQVIKATKPIIQFQPNFIFYSKDDKTFHPQIYGNDSISWGILCSYPFLYQDPKTHEIFQVREEEKFPNTVLFKHLQKWIREKTLPTPFLIDGEKRNMPLRLGKQCFKWIENHPHLKERNIHVAIS